MIIKFIIFNIESFPRVIGSCHGYCVTGFGMAIVALQGSQWIGLPFPQWLNPDEATKMVTV